MKNKNKGNQKHLSLTQRIDIKKALLNGENFASIARKLDKDPSTISKEIRKHSEIKKRKNNDLAPIPCANRKGCQIKYLCDELCDIMCTYCPKTEIKCIYICPNYIPKTCIKLDKPPYVCNGCGKRINCLMDMKVYSANYADDCYRECLIASREGINQTPESIMKMDNLVSPLIKKGQSIAHIYSHHAEEIGYSRRTLYNYLDQSVLTARNLDLRRRVKYKERRISTRASVKDKSYRIGRNYVDFQKYLKKHPTTGVVKMDIVEGEKGGKVFMTLFFRSCSLMLIFLLERKSQEAVAQVLGELSLALGLEAITKTFPLILTDCGPEFQNPDLIEEDLCGNKRTKAFYCDPYSSWQKGMIEKNHEYIRLVLPKGSSFNHLEQEHATLLQNHINSEARDSLNGCNPFKLSQLLLDNNLHQVLRLTEIAPDDVFLKPALLK